MLGKLMKYEVRATARTILPLYGVLLVLAIINRFFFFGRLNYNSYQSSGLVETLFLMAFVMVIVAVFVITFVVVLQRFYRNLLSDEGYLSFTLPVRPWQHITSKLLVATMWNFLSIVITFLALFLLVVNTQILSELPRILTKLFDQYFAYFGANGYFYFVLWLLAAVLATMQFTLLIYASVALGHLSSRHRLLASFGAFLVLLIIVSTVDTLAGDALTYSGFHHWLFYQSDSIRLYTAFFSMAIHSLFYGGCYFVITSWILSKKLNLE